MLHHLLHHHYIIFLFVVRTSRIMLNPPVDVRQPGLVPTCKKMLLVFQNNCAGWENTWQTQREEYRWVNYNLYLYLFISHSTLHSTQTTLAKVTKKIQWKPFCDLLIPSYLSFLNTPLLFLCPSPGSSSIHLSRDALSQSFLIHWLVSGTDPVRWEFLPLSMFKSTTGKNKVCSPYYHMHLQAWLVGSYPQLLWCML